MRRISALVAPLTSLLLVACASAAPAPAPRPTRTTGDVAARAGAPLTPWWTYHHSTMRSGDVTHAPGSPLAPAWNRVLGPVYGEPLVVGDTLIVATERNQVFGLDARTGATRWRADLGTPQPLSGLQCGNIDPLGITSTPAYDRRSRSVFVVAETAGGHHTLWALGARHGRPRWHRSLDVVPGRDRSAEQQRSAILVAAGRVIVSFGGLDGDCGNYVGYVTSTSTSGRGRSHHYAVPTQKRAGIWATPGPGLGRNGHVYVATGNGWAAGGVWDQSNAVLELTPRRLHLVSAFAPTTWLADSAADLDLGTTSPVSVPALHRIVVGGKRGRLYLLHESFHGVAPGIAHLDGCTVFSGPAVHGTDLVEPCLFEHQIRLVHVGRRSLSWGWARSGLFGAPVIAGGRVYLLDRDSGDLVVLRLSNGRVLQRIHAGSATHFPSVTVSGDYVFAPTLTGISAFRG